MPPKWAKRLQRVKIRIKRKKESAHISKSDLQRYRVQPQSVLRKTDKRNQKCSNK